MVKDINIAKFWKLLIIIPALLLLFACSGVEGNNSAIDENMEDNTSLEVKHRECWQSVVVGTIYDTTSRITMGMYGHMTQGAMALMMVAFAIWLSFRIMKHVSSFTEESPAEVWTEVMKKFFICFVCGLLATSTTGVIWVLNSIVFPIYNAFLELGSEMLGHFAETPGGGYATSSYEVETWMTAHNAVAGTTTAAVSGAADSLGMTGTANFIRQMYIPFDGVVEAKHTITCTVSNMDPATPEGFPVAPRQMMECLTCAVNERLNFGYKLGWVIMAQPGFMALICGLIMMLLFTFIKLGFVFYLVDSMFRFAMMVLLMPILIMAYAFKPTRGWTKTGFLTILNSAAFMMCIAIVILMALAAIQQILIDNKELFENDQTSLADFSKPLLMLMLVGFLLVGSMGLAQSIAGALVGGNGSANFQKRVAKAGFAVAAWALGGVASKVGKTAVNAAAAKSSKIRAVQGAFNHGKSKLQALAGDDEDES